MKVKVVSSSGSSAEAFEKKINEAMAGLKVVDVKFTEIVAGPDNVVYTSAYILYDDKKWEPMRDHREDERGSTGRRY
jgi:hypothetical protein